MSTLDSLRAAAVDFPQQDYSSVEYSPVLPEDTSSDWDSTIYKTARASQWDKDVYTTPATDSSLSEDPYSTAAVASVRTSSVSGWDTTTYNVTPDAARQAAWNKGIYSTPGSKTIAEDVSADWDSDTYKTPFSESSSSSTSSAAAWNKGGIYSTPSESLSVPPAAVNIDTNEKPNLNENDSIEA